MSSSFRSHLTVLEKTASLHPEASAFRLPVVGADGAILQWSSVSYQQFWEDVESTARHWLQELTSQSIYSGSVVGMWYVLNGMAYSDVLHIYGMSRAGYIPQLFSLRLPNADVICELLARTGATALICDPSLRPALARCPVPVSTVFDHLRPAADPSSPLPSMYDFSPNDRAFIFHTSGSTSGSPKLVPCTYRWIDCAISKGMEINKPFSALSQDVSTWMGSMCHIGQTCSLLFNIVYGSCTIQPTKIAFSSEELKDMVQRCGLNRLAQFATFLSIHIRHSKNDPQLLSMLQNLDEVMYAGIPIGREEEDWALAKGMNVVNLFGSTELGPLMRNVGGSTPTGKLVRPLQCTQYRFVPIQEKSIAESEQHQSTTAQLLELVVLPESGDCPDMSLRAEDGLFHTGDLFQEVLPGLYAPRGRNDDWIKSENSLRCDTKAIEDNVRLQCKHLIEECIVVGNGRPSPALFIEVSSESGAKDHAKVKKEIIRRIRAFHSRLYLHERITDPRMIIVVPSKTLPRTATKGNIRRKEVEGTYQEMLDELYAATRL
ncbi:acetyl-CoA synthetase-like protein [Pterulicium gracile]|uniref:Acetyl-CoA synthetase-like protein n=1 Tax=Pterulicium gracile TaxID=1884261 RepID=A0A5C3QMV9_9AGAR|nr:acetyl-CoA synthetase-like protein [Pterula gracilis]